MRNLLTSLLLGYSLTGMSQNFTDVVDSSKTDTTFKYNYTVDNNVEGPIYFFFDYTNLKNTGFEGELTHDGKSMALFLEHQTMPNNHFQSGPLTTFNGISSKGNWEFHVKTPEGTSIGKWGVFTIPEPSTFALLGIGMITLFLKRK